MVKLESNNNILQTQDLKSLFSGNSIDIVDIPSWFSKAELKRNQTDLIATSPSGEQLKFIDYFTNYELPSIFTENGLMYKGSLIQALAGPLIKAKYAQTNTVEPLSIGEVSSVTGSAKAKRLDGSILELSSGDPVFQGDTISVDQSGAVGLVFLDKSTLSLSEGGKMVLDELVYDPSTGNGSMAVDMVEGAFSFVSGEIAKTGPDAMKVSTPVATIGIRGTTVAGKAAVEGNENSFTLLQDADGGVGQISVSNAGGTQVLAQIGATTSISSFTAPPPPPIILSAAQIQANYGTALNVLPPTPVVAPTPQAPPPPQEQQQEQSQEEESVDEESVDEEVLEEETIQEGEDDGPQEGQEGPLEGEDGPPLGPDGEPLSEGEEGPPTGADGEPLAEEGPPLGPDGEPLAEGGPPLGPDGEPLPPGDFGPGGPPVGPDGEPLADGPPLGPDGEPLPPGDFGPDGPTPEQDAAAREAFETALAAGLSPEEAMAEAAAAAGFPAPPGGFGEDPLAVTTGGEEFAGGPGDFGPGGPGDFGPGGPGDFGPGGPGDFGPGGPGDFGPGGPGDFGPGGPGDFGPGGPGDFGPGGPGDFGGDPFGGPGDFGGDTFGGPAGFGDPFAGPGGPGDFGGDPFGGPVGFGDPLGGPGDPTGGFGNPIGGTGIEFGGPGYMDGPMEFGDPTIGMPGGETGGPFGGPGGMVPSQFMGAQPPGAASFAPIGVPAMGGFIPGPVAFGPGPVGGFGGPASMGLGDPFAGHSGPIGFGDPFGGPGGFGDPFAGPGGFGDPFGGPAGPGGFGDPFGGPGSPGGFGDPFVGPGGFFDPFGGGFFDPMSGGGYVPEEGFVEEYFFEDPGLYEYYGEVLPEFEGEAGEESGGGGSASTTFSGTNAADNVDKSSETVAWRLEGFSGSDVLKGGSAGDTFWGAIGSDTLTGNGGSDTFYYGDSTEGNDTITDFSAADVIKFGHPFTSSYSRSSYIDGGGLTAAYNTGGANLPKIFNFTANNANYNSSSGVAGFLSSFVLTTDGSTPISTPEEVMIITGDGNNSTLWNWSETGNGGTVSAGELMLIANLNNLDNDSLSAGNFSFGPI